MSVLDDVGRVRRVTWTNTETATVFVGHHACDWCGMVSPDPSHEEVIAYCKDNRGVRTMWPFGGEAWGEFIPPGWTLATRRSGSSHGTAELCPTCSIARDEAVNAEYHRRRCHGLTKGSP